MPTKVYRGRNEIIAQMLHIIMDGGTEGVSRTSIMYKSYLSHAQLKEYLSLLMEKVLIEESPRQIRSSGNERQNNREGNALLADLSRNREFNWSEITFGLI